MNGQLVMLNSEIPGIHSGRTPFYNQRLADSYAHFYHLANRNGERMYFGGAEDFQADGTIRGHWVPRDGQWLPADETVQMGMLFDKLGGNDPLFMSVIDRTVELEIPIYGHVGLNRFTGDKWACYEAFPEEHALTRLIEPDRRSMEDQIDSFFTLMDRSYESHDDVAVIKPRWGWESRGLYLLTRGPRGVRVTTLGGHPILEPGHVDAVLDGFASVPYIIQAYVNTGHGIPELGLQTERHDARFIFSISEPGMAQFFQAYVKTPSAMLYYPIEAFPRSAFEILESVADKVAQMFPYGIFSVDIMRDISGRWYLTELNDQVGFNIDFSSPRDIDGVTQLMERYLSEIYRMRSNLESPQYRSAV